MEQAGWEMSGQMNKDHSGSNCSPWPPEHSTVPSAIATQSTPRTALCHSMDFSRMKRRGPGGSSANPGVRVLPSNVQNSRRALLSGWPQLLTLKTEGADGCSLSCVTEIKYMRIIAGPLWALTLNTGDLDGPFQGAHGGECGKRGDTEQLPSLCSLEG
jgi:hypothetical protein